MSVVAVPKSQFANRLEGLALSAVFSHMPTFAGAAMLLELVSSSTTSGPGGAAVFVAVTSVLGAFASMWFGRSIRRFFATTYEPIFFDASLSMKEKLTRWTAQPKIAQQLATAAVMLAVLGTALASNG